MIEKEVLDSKTNIDSSEPLLTANEAAEYLKISPATLASDVSRQSLRIPYVKLGSRMRRYRLKDLIEYVELGLKK